LEKQLIGIQNNREEDGDESGYQTERKWKECGGPNLVNYSPLIPTFFYLS